MIMNEKEETKCPRSGGMGENTPFTKQSKEKGAGQGSGHTVSLQFQFKVQFLLNICLSVEFILLLGSFTCPPYLGQPCYVTLGWALDLGLISRHDLGNLSIGFLFPKASCSRVCCSRIWV